MHASMHQSMSQLTWLDMSMPTMPWLLAYDMLTTQHMLWKDMLAFCISLDIMICPYLSLLSLVAR